MFIKKKKLGLALGSGGAKGMAHVGALRALEECGLSFSAVAGTSIGSIVGAMYAKGYSSTDMRELLGKISWKDLAVSVLVSGSVSVVRRILGDWLDESDFSELKIPFAAIATDAESGEERVFREGSVSDSILASSAMPPFFRGVQIRERTYVDGAFVNAVPGDAVRSLGADFVLGIALWPKESYQNSYYITTSGKKVVSAQKGFPACDYLLTPRLDAYTPTSVLGATEMYDIGYECVKKHQNDIFAALKGKKISV